MNEAVEVINELLLEIQNLRNWSVWPPPDDLPPGIKRAFVLLHGHDQDE